MAATNQSDRISPRPAADMRLEVWGATDKGRKREGNEDSLYPHSGAGTFPFEPNPQRLAQKGQLLVVADGVGGAQAGREASQWAIRVAVERYYDMPGPDLGADLRSAVEIANTSLYQYLQQTKIQEAGCTMAAAVIHGDMLQVANVGDSRVYLLRGGQLVQQTRDHTLTQSKLDQGLIRPDQAETDSGRNVLTRSLGAGQSVKVDLFPPLQLTSGDVVLLCSDGLTDMVDEAQIARILTNHAPKRAAQRLIDVANKNGGFDNITNIVARLGGRPPALGSGLQERAGDVSRLGLGRKAILVALALAVLLVCALLGWAGYRTLRELLPAGAEPTSMPTATAQAVPTATTEPAVAPTMLPPTDTAAPGAATSTPAPTLTPTNTPTPRPPDTDRDGVIDRNDLCPSQPGLPELNGCPDRDRDGVADGQDACPDEPGPVDNGGCPTGGGGDGGDDGGGGGGGGDGGDGPEPTAAPPDR
jgi:protein phosphatase